MTDEEMAGALQAKGWSVQPPMTSGKCWHLDEALAVLLVGSGMAGGTLVAPDELIEDAKTAVRSWFLIYHGTENTEITR